MSITTRPLPGTTIDPRYPDSDGEPLGETQLHIIAIFHLYGVLRQVFRGRADVVVLADSFMYYEEGNAIKSKAPDVMVAFGVVGNHLRRSFRISEEGVVPSVIFEITSKKTRHEDEHGKKETYARLGVKEYFLFEPEDLSIDPRMKGFRLREGKYVALSADADGRLMSQELGLLLEVEDALLRVADARTGKWFMTDDELVDAVDDAKQRADEARREAEAQHQRVADLEAEIAKLRADAKKVAEQ
jgi:Uma2 family endonuclease